MPNNIMLKVTYDQNFGLTFQNDRKSLHFNFDLTDELSSILSAMLIKKMSS